nr:hypothetical protein [uncultured Methanoregula sp.]
MTAPHTASTELEEARFVNSDIPITKIHKNLAQEVIVTTEDKIKICLLTHVTYIEKRKDWIAPLGMLFTIIITLSTTSFNTAFNIDPSTWRAIFIIGGLLSFIWLIISVYYAIKSKGVDDIIGELKPKPSIK